jgi:hypothetical protein
VPREAAQQIIDLGARRRRQRCARNALGVMGNCAALAQDILAYSKTNALLLLITNEREMRVE